MPKFKIGNKVIATFNGSSIKTTIVGLDVAGLYGLTYIIINSSGWKIDASSSYKEKYNMSQFSKRYSWISERDIKLICPDCHIQV